MKAWIGGHPILAISIRRLVGLVPVVIALVFASFMIARLIPGDPAVAVVGQDASAAQLAVIRHELGIDQPLGTQFVAYLLGTLHGQLGTSFEYHEPVTQVIAERIGPSLELSVAAILLVMLLSVPGGLLAAILAQGNAHRGRDAGFAATTGLLGSLPEYVAATFLAYIFAVWLRWLPVAGDTGWQSLVLPAFAVALRPIALLARIVRAETLNVLDEDYIRTARAKRLPETILYLRHVLPNVLNSALTVGGLLFAHLIGGAVIVENVFARTGLGTEIVSAILARDLPVVQGVILVLGVAVLLVNGAVDVLIAVLDPRAFGRQV